MLQQLHLIRIILARTSKGDKGLLDYMYSKLWDNQTLGSKVIECPMSAMTDKQDADTMQILEHNRCKEQVWNGLTSLQPMFHVGGDSEQ